jgi:hypothetical protein
LCAPVTFAAQTAAPAAPIRDVAGNLFALAVRGDGSVVSWGRAPGGTLAVPTPIALPGPAQRVAVGESSAYALLEDGTVVASLPCASAATARTRSGPTARCGSGDSLGPGRGILSRNLATPTRLDLP